MEILIQDRRFCCKICSRAPLHYDRGGGGGGGFSQWHRQLIFTLADFLKELNLVYTKHMTCISSHGFELAVKRCFLTQPHQHTDRDTLEKESRGLTFPTYRAVSGFLCAHMQPLGVSEEPSESRGLSWHQPEDCKWYSRSFYPSSAATSTVLFGCWTSITGRERLPGWPPCPIRTCCALRNVGYGVPSVWERQLQWCHSYFMLLLLKKNSPLTQTPRQSTFKLLTVKSCSCMRISYTLYLTLQTLFWMTTINFLTQERPFKYLSSF